LSDRAERIEPFGPRPLGVRALEVAGSHVVGRNDLGHRSTRLLWGYAPERLSDDDADLAFVLHLLALRRQRDRVPVADHTRGRFEENERLGRDGISHFLGVVAVVAAHANDLSGAVHRSGMKWCWKLRYRTRESREPARPSGPPVWLQGA